MYNLTHASACSEGGNSALPLSERNPFLLFQSSTHVVSDAMTGELCAVVCEVSAVTHYQRRRMVESIDRVRL
jgi:hypothetical protein